MLKLHRRMHIAVHCDVHTCVSKDFTETLYIESQLDTSGCECVAQCMKINIVDIAFAGYCFEAIFHIARLYITVYHSRKQVRLVLLL